MSFLAGIINFFPGIPFRNATDTTDDPNVGGLSWLQLWRREARVDETYTPICFCCMKTPADVGAHIVLGDGTDAKDAPIDRDTLKTEKYMNRVFIVPLCYSCNSQGSDTTSVQLTIKGDVSVALRLCCFYQDERFDEVAFEEEYEAEHGTAYLNDSAKWKQFENKIIKEEADYKALVQKKIKNATLDGRDLAIIKKARDEYANTHPGYAVQAGMVNLPGVRQAQAMMNAQSRAVQTNQQMRSSQHPYNTRSKDRAMGLPWLP